MVVGSVVGVMSRGGDIIYVSHEFAMNITIVPRRSARMPRVQWPSFAFPFFPAVPAVVIEVERERLDEEQGRVQPQSTARRSW